MQRVAIASVIAMKPKILVLDEPTSQLDPQGSEEVFSVVEKLSEEGMTIIMAEHKMDKIANYADRVLLMDDGEIIDFDVPGKVFTRDDLQDYGVEIPVVTRIAKSLGIKNKESGYFPVTIKDLAKEIGDKL